ncbi:MAG TPA: hypothetical protein VGF69_17965 [Thermoanaerobaculia bacterium]|jgi:uncharacterized membrane protein YgcG
MKKFTLVLLIGALLALPASALDTKELLATIAMPLAVAAVADIAGVPASDLTDLVIAMNQANVPATQFVEVIRYTPVALVDPSEDQPFVAYVQERSADGIRGEALADSMVDRLQTRYEFQPEPALHDSAATTIVVEDDYIPSYVVTRVASYQPATVDPLALIALPLAVAAVSEISGVPQLELANLVAMLNQANVPPVQMVEVVRFAPAALVIDGGTPFMTFVRTQTTNGITGPALVPVLATELRTYYPAETRIAFRPASTEFFERELVPPVVVTRTAEVRQHPHGGPPGQLKKQLGFQTGAEVVHGAAHREPKARTARVERTVAPAERPQRAPKAEKVRGDRGRDRKEARVTPAPARVIAVPKPERVEKVRPQGHGNSGKATHGNAGNGNGNGNGKSGNKGSGGGNPGNKGGGKGHGKG